jgi:hypothetical protein
VKRVPLAAYRAQRRGGKGKTGMSTREEDISSEEMHFSHPDFRQSERGDPSEDRILEHSTELKNRLEPRSLPENFSDFEKLEEESQKSHYDSSKEDRGDPFRETWIDGGNEENPLRQSGIWDRETGQKAPQDAPQLLSAPEAAVSPSILPETPAPQKPEATTPPLKKTIRNAGEWPILPTTEE